MEMILQEKAWEVPKDFFSEPWHAPDICVLAETRSKAKVKALHEIRHDEYENSKGEPIDFLNIKIVRAKRYDRYLINGEVKTLSNIIRDKEKRDRDKILDKLLVDNPGANAYIKKANRGYYRDNHSGYADTLIYAGIYTMEEAVNAVRGCDVADGMEAIIVDSIEHNKLIYDRIFEMESSIERIKERLIT